MVIWIYSPAYDSASGGIVVLHLLAETLHRLGEEVRLVTPASSGYQEVPHIELEFDDNPKNIGIGNDDVVVYPEVVCGNPLGAKRVVRWLLNKPGVIGGDGVFDERDLILAYSKNFTPNYYQRAREFSIISTGLSVFVSPKGKRNRLGIFVRKGKNYRRFFPLRRFGWVLDSTPYKGNEELARAFGQCFAVVSYDAETYHSVQAAIAGCVSVVVPKKGLSRKQFRNHVDTGVFRYGIAYGIFDIPRAILTRRKLIEVLERVDGNNRKVVANFVQIVNSFWDQ